MATKSAPKAKAKPAEPALEERDRVRLTRDVAAVMGRYRQRESAFEEVAGERDRVIRAAMAAGLPRSELGELTGLSVARLDQIRAGRR